MGGGSFLSTPSARRATHRHLRVLQAQDHFYPRPPRGGRPANDQRPDGNYYISIHALREEGDVSRCSSRSGRSISIHALREEGDPLAIPTPFRNANFYPRPPRGGRQSKGASHPGGLRFLSTPSARRATRSSPVRAWTQRYFYPRPPRGGRHSDLLPESRQPCISIHALREEGDQQQT